NDARALPARARVVVVGGGVVGCSTAYHLAKRGWTDVVLVERKRLTSGTTWHAAGLITQARPTYGTREIVRRSLRVFHSLEEETGFATGFEQTGTLHLADGAERLEELLRQASAARANGITCPARDQPAFPRAARHRDPGPRLSDPLALPAAFERSRAAPQPAARPSAPPAPPTSANWAGSCSSRPTWPCTSTTRSPRPPGRLSRPGFAPDGKRPTGAGATTSPPGTPRWKPAWASPWPGTSPAVSPGATPCSGRTRRVPGDGWSSSACGTRTPSPTTTSRSTATASWPAG